MGIRKSRKSEKMPVASAKDRRLLTTTLSACKTDGADVKMFEGYDLYICLYRDGDHDGP